MTFSNPSALMELFNERRNEFEAEAAKVRLLKLIRSGQPKQKRPNRIWKIAQLLTPHVIGRETNLATCHEQEQAFVIGR